MPPPVIPTIEDTSSLLLEGWRARDKGMLQGILVLIFGGLRPNAEMMKFQWSNYDPEGFLNVGGDRSKNEGSARRVKISDVAKQWLDYAKGYLDVRKTAHFQEMSYLMKQRETKNSFGEYERKRLLALKKQHLSLIHISEPTRPY